MSHVYVDDEWFGKLEPIGDLERELLDATASSRRASREPAQLPDFHERGTECGYIFPRRNTDPHE
jgi:hypothetical protein